MFTAHINSPIASSTSPVTENDLVRLLERSIRESDAIGIEYLCIKRLYGDICSDD